MESRYLEIRRLLFDAVLIAIAVSLAAILHSVGGRAAGSLWVPMWWGPFLAGLLLGPIHGLIVGFLTPFTSFIIRGLPPFPFWLVFSIEISIYGFMWGIVSVLFSKFMKVSYVRCFLSSLIGIIVGKLSAALVLMLIIPSLVPKMASTFLDAFMIVLVKWTLTSLPGIILIVVGGPFVVLSVKKLMPTLVRSD